MANLIKLAKQNMRKENSERLWLHFDDDRFYISIYAKGHPKNIVLLFVTLCQIFIKFSIF